MVNRLTLFFLLVFVWLSFEGCTGLGQIIDKSTLSPEEIEKVQAVRLIEANELDENSYKFIKKVKGLSCLKLKTKIGFFTVKNEVEGEASREKSVEQTKIYAIRAGGNAITNLVCLFDAVDWSSNCWRSIECQADAIQVE